MNDESKVLQMTAPPAPQPTEGQRIRELRARLRMTQEQFAHRDRANRLDRESLGKRPCQTLQHSVAGDGGFSEQARDRF